MARAFPRWLGGCAAMLLLGVAPLAAHHAIAAKFDSTKPLTLRGTVTAIDWANPHAQPVLYDFLAERLATAPWAREA